MPKPAKIHAHRKVVCAAIRAADGSLLIGIRHYSADMIEQIDRMEALQIGAGLKFQHRHGDDQGFVDQFGIYMTRSEAYQVAKAEGQIARPHACIHHADGTGTLFSEGLY